MFAFLVTLLVLDALLLSVVVLLQAGQGGGLASLGGGGTDTVLGGRQAVTILTKLSWWCGGIFLVLSLVLSLVPRGGNSSALQERLRAASPAAPAQQAPLPLGQPSQPSTTQPSSEAPKPGTAPATGTPQSRQAPLPLGTPDKPAPQAAPKGAPAPQQPRQ
jgi:preprotein translocase subunit SecG